MRSKARIFSILLVIFCLSEMESAFAGDFQEKYKNQVNESAAAILSKEDDPTTLNQMIDLWKKKQQNCEKKAGYEHPICALYECDVIKNCRKDHQLIFRGEPGLWSLPATSQFWRSMIGGSSFADGISSSKTLEKLDFLRQESNAWLKETYPDVTDDSNYIQYLFGEHAQGNPMEFDDPILAKKVGVDPMISFSANPLQAAGFALNEEGTGYGRVVVLSVPEKEIQSMCSDAVAEPGALFQSFDECAPANEYSEELEVDAFVFVKASYVWKVFTSF